MKVSGKTEKLISDINSFSDKSIKNIYEISVLADIYISKNRKAEFMDLIFSAKYVRGLKSVLSNKTTNADNFTEKMFNEFNTNLQKVMEQLKKITDDSEVPAKKFFSDKYFQMDQNSISNTMELIEDLSLCKEFFNRHPEV